MGASARSSPRAPERRREGAARRGAQHASGAPSPLPASSALLAELPATVPRPLQVGPDAAEIMQGLGIALKCNATKAQFDSCVGIHPSAAEEWVTMNTPARCAETPRARRPGLPAVARGSRRAQRQAPAAGPTCRGDTCSVTDRAMSPASPQPARAHMHASVSFTGPPACCRRVACAGKFAEPTGAETDGYKNDC